MPIPTPCNAFVLHRFTPSFLKSSSTLFIHLSLGRPLPLLPSNFPSKVFFTDLISFILITCPSHSNLRIFITVTISCDLYFVSSSKSVLILHCPFSFLGPYIFLSIFLSHVINIFSILFVKSPCICSICHSCILSLWYFKLKHLICLGMHTILFFDTKLRNSVFFRILSFPKLYLNNNQGSINWSVCSSLTIEVSRLISGRVFWYIHLYSPPLCFDTYY